MTRTTITTTCGTLLATTLLLGIGACTPTPTRESASEYANASLLTTKVKTALATGDGLKSLVDVQVETYRDTVQLSGFVDSEADRARAEDIAREVEGVGRVQNAIALKSES